MIPKTREEKEYAIKMHFIGCIEDFFMTEISRPELLNRIGNNIFPFNYIDSRDVQVEIIKSHLKGIKTKIEDMYRSNGYKIEFDDATLANYLIDKYSEQISRFGARGIANAIELEFVYPLAIGILGAMFNRADNITFRETVKNEYLFSWDDIPEIDSEQLVDYLLKDLKIDWAKDANINKIDNGKTVTVIKDNNSLELKLNENEDKVILKTGTGENREYLAKKENGKLNIYKNEKVVVE